MHFLQRSTIFYCLWYINSPFPFIFVLDRAFFAFLWEIEAPLTPALTPGVSNRDNTVFNMDFFQVKEFNFKMFPFFSEKRQGSTAIVVALSILLVLVLVLCIIQFLYIIHQFSKGGWASQRPPDSPVGQAVSYDLPEMVGALSYWSASSVKVAGPLRDLLIAQWGRLCHMISLRW